MTKCDVGVDTVERLWPAAMRAMPVPTALVDPVSRRFLDANDAWCSAMRRSRDELRSLTWMEISASTEMHRGEALAQQLVDGARDSFKQSKRYVRGDGTLLTAEIEVRALRDEVGRDICHVVQFIDVPEEGSLRAVLRLLTDAPSANGVAAGLAHGLLGDLEPETVMLYVLDHHEHLLRIVAHYGLTEEDIERFGQTALDLRLPGCEVARSGVEMTMPIADMVTAYPLTTGWVRRLRRGDNGEIIIWPLIRRGLVIGTLFVSTARPIERTWELHARFAALALALAAWVQVDPPAMDRRHRTASAGRLRSPVTGRQREILEMLRDGLSNGEIAIRIGYSVATVRADLASLYRALGAKNRSDALARAERAGL